MNLDIEKSLTNPKTLQLLTCRTILIVPAFTFQAFFAMNFNLEWYDLLQANGQQSIQKFTSPDFLAHLA